MRRGFKCQIFFDLLAQRGSCLVLSVGDAANGSLREKKRKE